MIHSEKTMKFHFLLICSDLTRWYLALHDDVDDQQECDQSLLPGNVKVQFKQRLDAQWYLEVLWYRHKNELITNWNFEIWCDWILLIFSHIITVDCLDGNYDACQLKIKSAKDEDEEEEECVFVVRRFVERICLIEKLIRVL